MTNKRKILFTVAFMLCAAALLSLPVKAATLNLVTSQNTFNIGDKFSVDVKIDTENAGINAAQATIKFPADILSVSSTDKTNSVFNFWLQDPTVDNNAGTVTFVAGATVGFTGKSLEAFRINFVVKGAGQANISITDGAVTASDGSGSNVLTAMNGLAITSATVQGTQVISAPTSTSALIPQQITPVSRPAVPTGKLPQKPEIQVPLYPDPTSWYNVSSNFIVHISLPSDVTDVATDLNKNPSSNPTKSEGLFDNKTFGALDNGVWYLHVRFKNDVGWGPILHYKISVDTIPPQPFSAVVKEGNNTNVINPTLTFETTDQPSGIAFYRIVIDDKTITSTSLTSFTLPPQDSGSHVVVVEAVDQAGNITASRISLYIQGKPFFVIGGFGVSQTLFFVVVIILIILGAGTGWYLGQLEKKKRQMRIVIAQRHVITSFNIITKEIDNLLAKYADDKIDEREAEEMKFALKRLKEEADKIKDYVASNIEEIDG